MDKAGSSETECDNSSCLLHFPTRRGIWERGREEKGGGRGEERFKVLKNIILCLPGCLSACLFKGSEIKSSILFFSLNVRAIPRVKSDGFMGSAPVTCIQ